MSTEGKVIRLLDKRPSYLKCGNKRIALALGIDENDHYVLNEIKEAKKVYKRRLSKKEVSEVEVLNIDKNFAEQFKLMAKQMGYIESPSTYSKITSQTNNFKKAKDVLPDLTPAIKDQVGMHILMGCNHVPFHNVPLHDGMLRLVEDYKRSIKGFHLMGDFMDLNALSFHDKGKFTAVPGLTLHEEYAAGNHLLDQIDAALPDDIWKTYMYGNHEDRFNRWMSSTDNSKTPLMSPTNALNLKKRGYHVKESWSRDYFTIGNHLDIFHGIYFSIHCAKAHLDKLRGSCAFVHTHRTQMYVEGNMAAFNIGACADFESPAFNYATRPMKSAWSNGFAICMIASDGSYNMTQIMVNKDTGKFFFGGKEY